MSHVVDVINAGGGKQYAKDRLGYARLLRKNGFGRLEADKAIVPEVKPQPLIKEEQETQTIPPKQESAQSVDHANELIKQLPEEVRDNYKVYQKANGQIIVSRVKADESPQFRYENGELVPVSNQVNAFKNIKEKLNINHSDLSKKDIDELKTIEKDRNLAVARRDKALLIKNEVKRTEELKEAQKEMRDASEALGEKAASIYVKKTYPGATPLKSNFLNKSKQGQFDQIYQTQDGKIVFIEAKGGNASWGSRNTGDYQAEQGSKEYMESVIKNYDTEFKKARKNPDVDKNSVEFQKLKQTRDTLVEAKDLGEPIGYIGIKQKASDSGISDKIDIYIFEV